MAKNTTKRIPVKWVRDKAKAAYEKKSSCYICNTNEDLELHHTHSITLLLNNWANEKNYDISTDQGILMVREEFIETYKHEIYDEVYTLCNPHHVSLHSVYGKAPPLGSEARQGEWIEKQRAKYQEGYVAPEKPVVAKKTPSPFSPFAEFY
jgi:hypothetical protein